MRDLALAPRMTSALLIRSLNLYLSVGSGEKPQLCSVEVTREVRWKNGKKDYVISCIWHNVLRVGNLLVLDGVGG